MFSSLLFLIIILKVFIRHILACHPAEYQIGEECCPRCLAGSRVKTDCTEFRSTSCLPCTDGTYMNQPTGLKYCLTCGNCDAGSGLQIKTSCTSTSNTVCQPLEGFYCMDSTEDGCVKALKHTSCQPGQYIRQKGTSGTDTVCDDCQPGYFSQDGVNCTAWTICAETQVMVKEGTQTNDVVCGSASRNRYFLFLPLSLFSSLTLVLMSRETQQFPHEQHLATVVRKNSPLTGRNLKQNPALGGRPSALTGWEGREGCQQDCEGPRRLSPEPRVSCEMRKHKKTLGKRQVQDVQGKDCFHEDFDSPVILVLCVASYVDKIQNICSFECQHDN